jgi:hypothetical protein
LCSDTPDSYLLAIAPGWHSVVECRKDGARVTPVEHRRANVRSVPPKYTVVEEKGDIHLRKLILRLQRGVKFEEILAHSSVVGVGVGHKLPVAEYESGSETAVVTSAGSAILSEQNCCGGRAGIVTLSRSSLICFTPDLGARSSGAYGQKDGTLCWNAGNRGSSWNAFSEREGRQC